MLYTVLIVQNAYPEPLAKRAFWFYHNAKKFAESKAAFFDNVYIIKSTTDEILTTIKETK